jgi:zinc protease
MLRNFMTESSMPDSSYLSRLPTERRRLDNGLTVIVREDHSAAVVAVVTYVKAGYFDETDDIIGISHVLEHMYFKGTARRGPGEIARETKSAGGYLNAGTIYDHTSYYTVLPSASLEQALDIQSDALLNSAIDAGELATELQVIIQEARRKLDNPAAVAEETLFELLFDHHRMRRWRIGHAEALARMTRDEIWKYYREMYTPSNAVLVIAGDVDTARAFDLAARYYGGMPAGEPRRVAGPQEPDRHQFRFRELSGDVTMSTIEWGWRTPAALHEDTVVLDVLATVLGQGRASRLYRNVREAGLVSSISAHNYTPTEVGVFTISAEARPDSVLPALQSIAATLRTIRDKGVSEDELDRARSILEARVIRRLETAEGQANMIAEWEALGDWRMAEQYMARAAGVTAVDLQRAARAYLRDDSGAVLVYRPASAPALEVDSETLAEMLFRSTSHTESVVRAAAPPKQIGASAKRIKPKRIDDGVHLYESGGANIVIVQRTSAPLVSMSLIFRGGTLQESASEAGITSLMARASVKGTATRTGDQLAVESEALGTTIGYGVGADSFEWGMTVPSRHFDAGLELLTDAALAPSFPQAEVMKERDMMLRDLQQLRDDMYQYPMRLALEAAFGAHPYGFSPHVIETALQAMDATMLDTWHRARVLKGEPWFFAVGDIADPDACASSVLARIRDIHFDGHALSERRPVWPTSQQARAEQRSKQQTAIVLAFPGPDRNAADLEAMRLLASAVSGLGGRLFEELRSKRSLAYAISAFPMARWRAGAFMAYIGTSPQRESEAREGLLEQLGLLRDELLDGAEVERAKQYAIGAWHIRNQTNSAVLGELANAILFGRGVDEIRTFEQRIRAITADDMREAARKYLVVDRVVEGVVRGAAGDVAEVTTET